MLPHGSTKWAQPKGGKGPASSRLLVVGLAGISQAERRGPHSPEPELSWEQAPSLPLHAAASTGSIAPAPWAMPLNGDSHIEQPGWVLDLPIIPSSPPPLNLERGCWSCCRNRSIREGKSQIQAVHKQPAQARAGSRYAHTQARLFVLKPL